MEFSKLSGRLTWNGASYAAISGPYRTGALPEGSYTVRVRHVVVGGALSSSFKDPKTGNAWFIPISPDFETDRSGLGIHPDGGIPGTEGCIGLRGADAGKFWQRWNKTPMGARPTTLTVEE